jgi:hypothetical protein
LKNNPQEGSPVRKIKSRKSNGAQRGRKRKLAATSDISDLDLDEDSRADSRAMRPWFKGTVWRTSPSPEKQDTELYEPGLGERVALLRNWREVFKASQPFASNRGKGGVSTRAADHKSEGDDNGPVSMDEVSHDTFYLNGNVDNKDTEADEETSRERKRPRVSFAADGQSLQNHNIVVEIPARHSIGVRKQGTSTGGTEQKPATSKKRKASDVEDETTTEIIGTRAKRVASGKAPPKTKEDKKPPPLSTTRATRSKKK